MSRRPVSPERAAKDAEAWALLHEVLAGRATSRIDADGLKTGTILRSRDVDAEISASGFEAHLDARRARPTTYYLPAAPQLIGSMMLDAGIARIESPTVIGLPERSLTRHSFRNPSSLVWIIPGEGLVLIRIRSATPPVEHAWSKPAGASGPLAFPPDLPMEEGHGPPTHLQLAAPRRCPRCGNAAREFRELREHLVCRACGCSFRRSALLDALPGSHE